MQKQKWPKYLAGKGFLLVYPNGIKVNGKIIPCRLNEAAGTLRKGREYRRGQISMSLCEESPLDLQTMAVRIFVHDPKTKMAQQIAIVPRLQLDAVASLTV